MKARTGKLLGCALAALAMAAAGGAIHPFGPVKSVNAAAILDGAVVDPATLETIERSCGSCHSEGTKWPWYSYAAPASWMLERDVSEARSRMNLSRWGGYSAQERETLLSAIGAVARTGEMPPRRYTLLHPEAELSSTDRARLYDWSRRERRRMKEMREDPVSQPERKSRVNGWRSETQRGSYSSM